MTSDIKDYAIVDAGFVVNTVRWDGEGDIFDGLITLEITDGNPAFKGDAYIDGKLYPKPRDGYDYQWSATDLVWKITDDGAKKKASDEISAAQDRKASLLSEANTYTQPWQTQLLLEIISDADKASLTSWMQYYQQLQAVDTNLGNNISWPVKPT